MEQKASKLRPGLIVKTYGNHMLRQDFEGYGILESYIDADFEYFERWSLILTKRNEDGSLEKLGKAEKWISIYDLASSI